MVMVIGILFVVSYIWGIVGFSIMIGLMLIIFFLTVLMHGDSEEDYYYDD